MLTLSFEFRVVVVAEREATHPVAATRMYCERERGERDENVSFSELFSKRVKREKKLNSERKKEFLKRERIIFYQP